MNVKLQAAINIREGLLIYDKHRDGPNTPSGMLRAATRYTGVRYRPGQFARAAADLTIIIELLKRELDHG